MPTIQNFFVAIFYLMLLIDIKKMDTSHLTKKNQPKKAIERRKKFKSKKKKEQNYQI